MFWCTPNITNFSMSANFENCKAMAGMFDDSPKLKTLYMGDSKNSDKIILKNLLWSGSNNNLNNIDGHGGVHSMFNNCVQLPYDTIKNVVEKFEIKENPNYQEIFKYVSDRNQNGGRIISLHFGNNTCPDNEKWKTEQTWTTADGVELLIGGNNITSKESPQCLKIKPTS